jgi:uncharacterized alkaline shock family protein YloU
VADQALLTTPAATAPATESAPGGDGQSVPPAQRGWVRIDDRVAHRIAEQASLAVPGVVRHSGALDRVTGRDLPRTEVVVAGDRVRASLDIAVSWPHPLAATAAAVRGEVRQQLQRLAGLTADAVDVAIVHVVPPEPGDRPGSSARRVQ